MQRLFRMARIVDTASVSAALFLLFFLWLRHRQLGSVPSVLLSTVISILMLYAFFLYKNQLQKRKKSSADMQSAVYALTMLSHEDALRHAAEALAEKFRLILLPHRSKDEFCIAYEKSGRRLSIALYAEPAAPDILTIHHLHRKRGLVPSVLICTTAPGSDALQYASSLSPPFRLILADALPLNDALSSMFPMDKAKKKRTALSLLRAGNKRAVRCMLFSFGLIVYYLLTEQRFLLIPSLLLAFFAVLSKEGKEEQVLF